MLGPSGSGKTTTLRMIAGFELPTEGRILLHGEDVSRKPPFERDVNTVFQDYALFPHMTVGENVEYGLIVKKVPKDERGRRVAEALRMVRLEGYDERKPGAALRRPAPAGRPRPGARQPAPRPAPRRAARRPRPEAPRGDADRAEGDPAGGRDHVHLRDPRPGGGAHDERPPRGLQPRPDRAGRHARPSVYERPATQFVAGFVGTSNLLTRRGRADDPRPGRHVHRPAREDPPRASPTHGPAPTRSPRRGASRRSSTSDPDTRYIVALDAGAELVVTQQNLATSSTEALAARRPDGPARLEAAAHPRRRQRRGRVARAGRSGAAGGGAWTSGGSLGGARRHGRSC